MLINKLNKKLNLQSPKKIENKCQLNFKLLLTISRDRNSPRKTKNSSRYSGLHHPIDSITVNNVNTINNTNSRLSWHGKDGHSTLIKIDWPIENNSISNLTTSTFNSSPLTPTTPNYETLESDSEDNKRTIKIENSCENCTQEKCLKCELKATDYENVRFGEDSPVKDISYQNLNRLSAVSTSSNSESDRKQDLMKIMTSSHESSSSYDTSLKHNDDVYECYNFTRPNYINLQSSSTSSPGSPLKSPLKSTISITFRSPTKSKNDLTPTNERDSIYEDVNLEKNLSIVEDASIPDVDASLPTPACQPEFEQDLIILETPTDSIADDKEVYNQVKFFKKSIDEVNAMILETPEKERHYENIEFGKEFDSINVDTLKICDKHELTNDNVEHIEKDNGNIIKSKNLNVRELAIRFESPTEQKGPFVFEKFKAEIKYPSLERKPDMVKQEKTQTSPKITNKLSKNSFNARSLDENAFIKEFGPERAYVDRRKSLEVRDGKKKIDLNLNLEEHKPKFESITPTTENKISLVQRFDVKPDLKTLIGFETEKKLSRERIEKYKEERRNFLREKYSSQSFRSNPEQLTRIKIKKDEESIERCERLRDDSNTKFERRNTVDLGQRMKFSLAKSPSNFDTIPSPTSPEKVEYLRDRRDLPDSREINEEYSRDRRDVPRDSREVEEYSRERRDRELRDRTDLQYDRESRELLRDERRDLERCDSRRESAGRSSFER